jgi:hypothetical protein
MGYVTATGISKQYSNQNDFQATAGKNNCPSDFSTLTPKWDDLGFPVGSLMKSGQSCGNENKYVQAEPPKTNFDWKFYLKNNPDLGNAGLTTEQHANDHWNTYGKQEGRLPNGTIISSMATLGKIGYIDVDTNIHTVPGTPTGEFKEFLSRSNVTGTQMQDCSRPLPVLKYGVPIVFVQNNQKGSLQTSSMAFGATSSEFFFRPPPGDDRQGQTVNYGDQLCLTTSSSSHTECGWWGCKVASVNTSNQMYFGPGGETTPTFYIIPPLENFDLMNTSYISGICVHPEFRKKGIATKMCELNVMVSILVIKGSTSIAKKELDSLNPCRVEIFNQDELMINITEHNLVPKHIVLKDDEKLEVLKKYRVKEH